MDKRILAVALSALLLSGCVAQTGTVSEHSSVPVTTADTQPASTEHSSEPEEVPDETRQVTAQPAETAESAGASVEGTSDVSSEHSSEEEVLQSTQPAPEVTTAAAESTAASATTVQTDAPEPVNVVIPEVRVPLSPGTSTAENDKVRVDYSNSADGYISVRWNETGKRVKLRITSGGSTYDHDVPTGGVTEYYPLSCGSGNYTVQIYEQTDGDRYAKVLEQEFTAEIRSETSPFLYPNRYVAFSQNSACVEKAAQLCAGRSGTIEKTAAIFGWVTDNVSYDRELAATVKSGYVPDPDSVLKKKTGICYDYASLMAAMLRSQGIPSRLVVGYAKESIYHAWNEVWTEQTGWITPELLLSRNGYNIVDATFYAGSADKAKIADYISNSGNYSALYYY